MMLVFLDSPLSWSLPSGLFSNKDIFEIMFFDCASNACETEVSCNVASVQILGGCQLFNQS